MYRFLGKQEKIIEFLKHGKQAEKCGSLVHESTENTHTQQHHHQLMENRSNGMIVQKTLSKHWYPIREADCFCISFFIRLRGKKFNVDSKASCNVICGKNQNK